MKSLLNIFLMILFAFLAHKFIPFWWFFAITTFLVSFAFGQSTWNAFLTGFVSIFTLWLVLTLGISIANDFILLEKIGALLKVPSSVLLIPITALIGGLIGGFSSMSGYLMKTFSE